MSEAKKRKIHGPKFKVKVDLEAVRGVKTINEIAQEYGGHPVQAGQYRKQIHCLKVIDIFRLPESSKKKSSMLLNIDSTKKRLSLLTVQALRTSVILA